MTKKLEDILNLPNVKEAFKKVDSKEKKNKQRSRQRNPQECGCQDGRGTEGYLCRI